MQNLTKQNRNDKINGAKILVAPLIMPLSKYSDIFISHDESEARKVIEEFFHKFSSIDPVDDCLRPDGGYYEFLKNAIPLQQALKNKSYSTACHEIETLAFCYLISQRRIYDHLLWLYSKYLEE